MEVLLFDVAVIVYNKGVLMPRSSGLYEHPRGFGHRQTIYIGCKKGIDLHAKQGHERKKAQKVLFFHVISVYNECIKGEEVKG